MNDLAYRAARRLVGVGEVIARFEGLGVVGAQHPLPVGQVLLMQGDRLGRPARVLVGVAGLPGMSAPPACNATTSKWCRRWHRGCTAGGANTGCGYRQTLSGPAFARAY